MQHIKSIVVVENQEYYVSTCDTFDVGLETMVFKSENGKPSSWSECYYRHYKTENEAIEGHKEISSNLEKFLKEGNNQQWKDKAGFIEEYIEYALKKMKEKESK